MVSMSSFDESKHPRGQVGNAGQFATKTNQAPTVELTEVPIGTANGTRTVRAEELERGDLIVLGVGVTTTVYDGDTRTVVNETSTVEVRSVGWFGFRHRIGFVRQDGTYGFTYGEPDEAFTVSAVPIAKQPGAVEKRQDPAPTPSADSAAFSILGRDFLTGLARRKDGTLTAAAQKNARAVISRAIADRDTILEGFLFEWNRDGGHVSAEREADWEATEAEVKALAELREHIDQNPSAAPTWKRMQPARGSAGF